MLYWLPVHDHGTGEGFGGEEIKMAQSTVKSYFNDPLGGYDWVEFFSNLLKICQNILTSGSRKWCYGSVSYSRHWHKTSVSESRNGCPETNVMDQCLDTETEIMGEGTILPRKSPKTIEIWCFDWYLKIDNILDVFPHRIELKPFPLTQAYWDISL